MPDTIVCGVQMPVESTGAALLLSGAGAGAGAGAGVVRDVRGTWARPIYSTLTCQEARRNGAPTGFQSNCNT